MTGSTTFSDGLARAAIESPPAPAWGWSSTKRRGKPFEFWEAPHLHRGDGSYTNQ